MWPNPALHAPQAKPPPSEPEDCYLHCVSIPRSRSRRTKAIRFPPSLSSGALPREQAAEGNETWLCAGEKIDHGLQRWKGIHSEEMDTREDSRSGVG